MPKMQNSKNNIIRIRTIMSKLPHFTEEDKEALCMQYSGGRTKNISKLTGQEGKQMIDDLQKQVPKDPGFKMKKVIIRQALELGWKNDEGKIDMKRLNAWCEKYGGFKKKLDDHQPHELQKLVFAFGKNYNYILNKI